MERLEQQYTLANGLTLKNALVMAPMTTWAGEADGRLSEAELAYYAARARGVGMVVTGTTYMTANGKGFTGQYFAGTEACLPQLQALAQAIQAGGAKAILQIFHAGRNSTAELLGGAEVVSASAVPAARPGAAVPRALAEEEIEEIIRSFADVTDRAMRAGFDGVEIHGANTYLLQQFFSPHANRRTDAWGGSRQARARLPLAVVDAVLEVVRRAGRTEFAVGYRLSPEEIEAPGITLDDSLYLVDQLAARPLAYLHLSLRHFGQTSQRDSQDRRIVGQVIAQHLAGRLPLIGVGGIVTRQDVAEAFALGYDLLAVGKALVYDPQWHAKVACDEAVTTALSVSARQQIALPEPMLKALQVRREALNVQIVD